MKSKCEIRGSLRYAAHDEAVSCVGRDDSGVIWGKLEAGDVEAAVDEGDFSGDAAGEVAGEEEGGVADL